MKKLTLITVLAIFAMITSGIAQPMQGKVCGKGMNMMNKIPGFNFYDINQKELNLSSAQLDKLNAIDDAFQKNRIDTKAKIQHSALEMKNEMSKTNINKDALLAKQENVQKLKNEMQKKALTYKLDLYNVLTDEQKSKIDDIKKTCTNNGNMGKQGRGNCNGMGQGPGMGQSSGMGNCFRR